MFKYFAKNKCNAEKGQIASFFVALIVLVAVMALITVNIGKIGFIKTEASNAADAGALAAGSVMANTFNAIGRSNMDLENGYWDFLDFIYQVLIHVVTSLTTAYILTYFSEVDAREALKIACLDPCSAAQLAWAGYEKANLASEEILLVVIPLMEGVVRPTIIDFHESQLTFYQDIRRTGEEGWCEAIKMGHRFAFRNSGIAEKLRDRGHFTQFLDSFDCQQHYEYPWTDGQNRAHMVSVDVNIPPIDTYELKVTRNTFPETIQALDDIYYKCLLTIEYLHWTQVYYDIAAWLLWFDCITGLRIFCMLAMVFLMMGINYNSMARDVLDTLFVGAPGLWPGLLPSDNTFVSGSGWDAEDQIITWIEDIIHPRTLRVDTYQYHQGGFEEGLWQTRYPTTHSWAEVSFLGRGQIHRPFTPGGLNRPELGHMPSLIRTDAEE